jgi:hypothetical protein
MKKWEYDTNDITENWHRTHKGIRIEIIHYIGTTYYDILIPNAAMEVRFTRSLPSAKRRSLQWAEELTRERMGMIDCISVCESDAIFGDIETFTNPRSSDDDICDQKKG